MFFVQQSLLWLTLGTLAAPSHWCCAVRGDAQPCCGSSAVEVAAPVKSCCSRPADCDADHGTRLQANHSTPTSDACCCRAADPVVPTSKSAPTDVPAATPFDASISTPTTMFVVRPSVDFFLPIPGENLQARLCCWRC